MASIHFGKQLHHFNTQQTVTFMPSFPTRVRPHNQGRMSSCDKQTALNKRYGGTGGREHLRKRSPSLPPPLLPLPPPPSTTKTTSDPYNVAEEDGGGGFWRQRHRSCKTKTSGRNNSSSSNSTSRHQNSGHNNSEPSQQQHDLQYRVMADRGHRRHSSSPSPYQHQHGTKEDKERRRSTASTGNKYSNSTNSVKRKRREFQKNGVRRGMARPSMKKAESDEVDDVLVEEAKMEVGVVNRSTLGEVQPASSEGPDEQKRLDHRHDKGPPRGEFRIEAGGGGGGALSKQQRQKGGCSAFKPSYDRQRFGCNKEEGGAALKRFVSAVHDGSRVRVCVCVCVLFAIVGVREGIAGSFRVLAYLFFVVILVDRDQRYWMSECLHLGVFRF